MEVVAAAEPAWRLGPRGCAASADLDGIDGRVADLVVTASVDDGVCRGRLFVRLRLMLETSSAFQ